MEKAKMKNVVIDDGSSQIKICWVENGQIKVSVFDTIVLNKPLYADGGLFSPSTYVVNGRTLSVSKSANESSRTDDSRYYQTSPQNRVCIHEALRMIGLGGEEVKVTTTLPVRQFFNDSAVGNDPINQAIKNEKRQHIMGSIDSKGGYPLAKIVDCSVSPEAIPVWNDLRITNDFRLIKNNLGIRPDQYILIVDIGGTTTDIVKINGNGVMQDINGSDHGVYNVADSLRKILNNSFDLEGVQDNALINYMKEKEFRGKDITREIKMATEETCENIYLEMRKTHRGSNELGGVVYVGGGAQIMGESLQAQYGGVTQIRDEFAIARGILKAKVLNGEIDVKN